MLMSAGGARGLKCPVLVSWRSNTSLVLWLFRNSAKDESMPPVDYKVDWGNEDSDRQVSRDHRVQIGK